MLLFDEPELEPEASPTLSHTHSSAHHLISFDNLEPTTYPQQIPDPLTHDDSLSP